MFQQVAADGTCNDCEADIAELRQMLIETRTHLQQRIAVNEVQLQERIASEKRLQKRIIELEQRRNPEASEKKTAVVSPCKTRKLSAPCDFL